jgi:hypothetical protein
VDVEIHAFLSSAIVVGKWRTSGPGLFKPGGNCPQHPFRTGLGGPQGDLVLIETREFLILPHLEMGLQMGCKPGGSVGLVP